MSTPVIGREGLLRLVGWAGQLWARDPAAGGASQAVRARAFSPGDYVRGYESLVRPRMRKARPAGDPGLRSARNCPAAMPRNLPVLVGVICPHQRPDVP
jgi:hypothetical protein